MGLFSNQGQKREYQMVIKKGQRQKRNGNFQKAISVYKEALEKYQSEPGTPSEFIAALWKSLGKAYASQMQFDLGRHAYIKAIELYDRNSHQQQVMTCLFHLGCCRSEFISTKLGVDYHHGLRTGEGPQPGMPGSEMTQQDVIDLMNKGNELYRQS